MTRTERRQRAKPAAFPLAALLLASLSASCADGPPPPAKLDAKSDTCRFCRMPVSDPSLAAQLVAPGEEPMFFDDIGCLSDYLREKGARAGAFAWVADHRTRAWVPARSAVFSRAAIDTPMGSHWIAHADAASRDADPAARGASPVEHRRIFGEADAPAGKRSAK